jgi:deoxyribodipyrimidine photo-lyase
VETFLKEIVWREFSHHLLFHFPDLPEQPFKKEFRAFPWASDEGLLGAWQRGLTGYPIVDAGMRELWVTGWMHNRVRMVVASFLVKHLLIPWQQGEAWFWDTLVDADLANNTQGWQWTAGSGADAAPYFRIFNPVSQGERFDPEGRYVKRWVPELARVPAKAVHQPWSLKPVERTAIGLSAGAYPEPIVDLKASREAALDAYQRMRGR